MKAAAPANPAYVAAWARFRRTRRVEWALIALAAALALAEREHVLPHAWAPAAVATWFLAVACALANGYLRCPRCGRSFFRKWGFAAPPLLFRCAHCGLPKWATSDPG